MGTAYLFGWHVRTAPVVEIILKVTVTDTKLQLLQELFIFH